MRHSLQPLLLPICLPPYNPFLPTPAWSSTCHEHPSSVMTQTPLPPIIQVSPPPSSLSPEESQNQDANEWDDLAWLHTPASLNSPEDTTSKTRKEGNEDEEDAEDEQDAAAWAAYIADCTTTTSSSTGGGSKRTKSSAFLTAFNQLLQNFLAFLHESSIALVIATKKAITKLIALFSTPFPSNLFARILVLVWNTFCLALLVLALFAVPFLIEKQEETDQIHEHDNANELKEDDGKKKDVEEDDDDDEKEDGESRFQSWKQRAEELRDEFIKTVIEMREEVVRAWRDARGKVRGWFCGRGRSKPATSEDENATNDNDSEDNTDEYCSDDDEATTTIFSHAHLSGAAAQTSSSSSSSSTTPMPNLAAPSSSSLPDPEAIESRTNSELAKRKKRTGSRGVPRPGTGRGRRKQGPVG